MKELIVHTVTVFMGFFAIMNPIANIPIFLSLTADEDKETIRSIALRSVFIAFIIIAIFSIAGKLIFDLFGITLYALRITGGILVFLIGFNMLQGDSTHQKNQREGVFTSSATGGIEYCSVSTGDANISWAWNDCYRDELCDSGWFRSNHYYYRFFRCPLCDHLCTVFVWRQIGQSGWTKCSKCCD